MLGRKALARVGFFLPAVWRIPTGIPGKGGRGTVLLHYKSSTESAVASQGGLECRQKQAQPFQAGESVAVLQPCHGHRRRRGGRTGARISNMREI